MSDAGLYGSTGQLAQLFDIPAELAQAFQQRSVRFPPGGHFFVDQFPGDVARSLGYFLA